ncbi:peptidyl-prolyl cis-trans isomerase [bacterium]|nr:peptidyl-prolyl cis-trans isomerase [candidate division CSSED10-310 bacterium]
MVLKNTCFLIAIVLCSVGAQSADNGQDPLIAVVGGLEIHQSDLDKKIEEVPPVARTNFETVEGQMKLLDRMVRTKAMMKAAEDAGYPDRPDIQDQLKEQRERILAYEYFKTNISAGPMPSESDLRNYYEEYKDQKYKIDATADIRQIVVADKATANHVKKLIEDGETTFEQAVDTYSVDESKESKGYIGGITENSFIRGIGKSKPFTDMVFSLKADQVSEPFQSNKGWHLVRLVSLRNEGYRPFEDVRNEIAKEFLVTPEDIQKEYTANSDKYMAKEQCKISHILLNTKEEADSVLAEFKAGKDFQYLVKTYSKDAQTANKDGNLGYLYRDGYVRGIGKDVEFENAVFALSAGDVSNPIKTRKGWHIVRVDEKQPAQVKPLVEVEGQIRQALSEKKIEDFQEAEFEKLNKKYNTKIFTENLKAK